MPESALWSIIVALVMLTLGLTLKNADLKRTLHGTQKDIDTARTEFKTLQDKSSIEISNIKELHKREIDELTKMISELSHIEPDIPSRPASGGRSIIASAPKGVFLE